MICLKMNDSREHESMTQTFALVASHISQGLTSLLSLLCLRKIRTTVWHLGFLSFYSFDL